MGTTVLRGRADGLSAVGEHNVHDSIAVVMGVQRTLGIWLVAALAFFFIEMFATGIDMTRKLVQQAPQSLLQVHQECIRVTGKGLPIAQGQALA